MNNSIKGQLVVNVALIFLVIILTVTILAFNRIIDLSKTKVSFQNAKNATKLDIPLTNKDQVAIYLTPKPVIVTSQTTTTSIDILLDTGSYHVSGVQIELSFDPTAVKNVNIVNPIQQEAYFEDPVILKKNVDQTNGKIVFILGQKPSDILKVGKGSLGTITFTPQILTGQSTTINILPTSEVSATEETGSVLNFRVGTTIIAQ